MEIGQPETVFGRMILMIKRLCSSESRFKFFSVFICPIVKFVTPTVPKTELQRNTTKEEVLFSLSQFLLEYKVSFRFISKVDRGSLERGSLNRWAYREDSMKD